VETTIVRNIQGRSIRLTLIEIEPELVTLDVTNPRVGFSMKQLSAGERSDAACTLLLTSQEDTEGLKRSIILSGGVQEPIYLRHNYVVAEGNRRVVALRAVKEQAPDDPRFAKLPAWLIPNDTPESTIHDLLGEIHLGSVRGWAPYEKALQMRALVASGLVEEEIAERYRMTASEVRQQIRAAHQMDELYFPTTADPTNPEHRSKFSYFLEFEKNTRLNAICKVDPELPQRFAQWVRDGQINTGAKVRRLPRILDSAEATRLLEIEGFDSAEALLAKHDPREHELYGALEDVSARLKQVSLKELSELAVSPARLAVLTGLRETIESVLETAERLRTTLRPNTPSGRKRASRR
jgi:hypothetical protein